MKRRQSTSVEARGGGGVPEHFGEGRGGGGLLEHLGEGNEPTLTGFGTRVRQALAGPRQASPATDGGREGSA